MDSADIDIAKANRRASAKFLSVVFGYMAIGLAITAVVSFVVALLFSRWLVTGSETATAVYLGLMIGGLIALLIDSFVIHHFFFKGTHSLLIPYVIYTALMGVFISSFLILGVDFATMGEAFGLTALVFLVMFLIGYFSPVDLNPLGMVAIGLLCALCLVSLFYGIFYLVGGGTPSLMTEYIFSIIVVVVMMVIVAVDCYNMSKTAQSGSATTQTALFYAFSMYCDFITLFVRILYIILIARGSRN